MTTCKGYSSSGWSASAAGRRYGRTVKDLHPQASRLRIAARRACCRSNRCASTSRINTSVLSDSSRLRLIRACAASRTSCVRCRMSDGSVTQLKSCARTFSVRSFRWPTPTFARLPEFSAKVAGYGERRVRLLSLDDAQSREGKLVTIPPADRGRRNRGSDSLGGAARLHRKDSSEGICRGWPSEGRSRAGAQDCVNYRARGSLTLP